MSQITQDANFLSGLGIMDYSLLVGVHDSSRTTLDQLAEDISWCEDDEMKEVAAEV